MNKRLIELLEEATEVHDNWHTGHSERIVDHKVFAELIVRECINKIETYQISVGNSSSGELACEWTYDALKDIRDDIKETFGVK